MSQRAQPDILLLPVAAEGYVRTDALDLVTGFGNELQERVKVCRFLFQRAIDDGAQQLAVGRFRVTAQPFVIAVVAQLWMLDDGQASHSLAGAEEIVEFPLAVE